MVVARAHKDKLADRNAMHKIIKEACGLYQRKDWEYAE